ncbi:MAG TPA: DUF4388 domain-containing protein, partial [Kofleriaceae bacterium]|nr:DUF4388 domain-containing protein [Kofleriaceae bacterium]
MAATSSPAPRLLLVANPAARDELGRMLAGGGFPAADSGDGGDATLTAFAEQRPQVVVMCADLDAGDPRALSLAMRDAAGEAVKIVLIGEERGPIRTALDASDFRVDRFVRRPLSPKALLFAVKSCIEPPPGASPTPPPGAAVRLLGQPSSRPTTKLPVPSAVDRAVDVAVDDFVSAAIGALGEIKAQAAPLSMIAPGTEREWEEPSPPSREPTLILSGGGAALEPAAPRVEVAVPRTAPIDATERGPGYSLWSGADRATADMVAELADLDHDLAGGEGGGVAVPEEAIDTPSGAFGRELRRKMSQMAERLFPHRRPDSGLLDVGVAHGHRTEIDLSTVDAIDDDATYAEPEVQRAPRVTARGMPAGPAPAPAHTDAGEPDDDTTRRASPAALHGRGTLGGADEDVATLLGHLFAAGFTGRVVFRDPPAEKTIHLDQGRPVFATSNLPHDRMGDLLFREGKITREQYARSREVVAESGRRMGEILVEMGFLTRRELLPAVRRHVEDIIYSLFAWSTGGFQLVAGDGAASER